MRWWPRGCGASERWAGAAELNVAAAMHEPWYLRGRSLAVVEVLGVHFNTNVARPPFPQPTPCRARAPLGTGSAGRRID